MPTLVYFYLQQLFYKLRTLALLFERDSSTETMAPLGQLTTELFSMCCIQQR